MLSTRWILTLAGLVLAYSAVYMGDGVYEKAWVAAVTEEQIAAGWRYLTVVTGAMVVGTFVLFALFSNPGLKIRNRSEWFAALVAILAGYLFGVLAGPFVTYGPYPWHWASRLDFLMLLALMPMVLVVRDLIAETHALWRTQQAARTAARIEPAEEKNVIQLGR